jgi:apolipoprotein N-acyltransferase
VADLGPSLRRSGWRYGLALLAGVALVFAFPPYGWWPLTVLAVTASTLALRGTRWPSAAGVGFVLGVVFFAGLMPWLRVIGVDAWLALSVECAAWFAGMGVATALVTRLRGWPIWVACVWVLQEALRGRIPWGGFGWGRLAFAQPDSWFTGLAAVGGAPLVSFAVALSGAALAWAITAWPGRRIAAVGLLAALGVALLGLLVPRPTGGTPIAVGVVQGNVPGTGMDAFGRAETVLDNHAAATVQLAADVAAGKQPQPDFVVWPENAADIDPFEVPSAKATIQAAARAIGVPLLVGVVRPAPSGDGLQNLGVVWDPRSGPGAVYIKRHPVPFGEYVPFRGLLTRWIGRFSRIPQDFVPGTAPGVLPIDGTTVGDVICFEVAYDGLVRDVVTGGGELITVQTNNATYGHTGQVEQQFAISQLRAVEHGRGVAVAATSGISGVIQPNGSVTAKTAEFTRAELVADVPRRTSLTLADRLGAGPEAAIALVGALAIVAGVHAARSRVVENGPVTSADATAAHD